MAVDNASRSCKRAGRFELGIVQIHTFFQDEGSRGTSLGINVIAIAAMVFLVIARRREKPVAPQAPAVALDSHCVEWHSKNEGKIYG